MGFGFVKVFLSLCLISSFMGDSTAQTQPFKCDSGSNCTALIDYVHVSPNSTTLYSIRTLFGVKNLRTILGANNLPLNTPQNRTVKLNDRIKIPFPCVCTNGTGISNKLPVYTVKPGESLSDIADVVFSRLVTFQQIGAASNISNLNLILAGQKLVIPLPCSCDEIDDQKVVHYGHVVEAGSSVELIAQEYGTSGQTLMKLNGILNANDLKAGQVLDVPLKACKTMIKNGSLDYPLLVANSTYVFTAKNCVKCKCDSAYNYTLQCEPSQIKPSGWSSCPAMQCEGGNNLSLGNITSATCNQTTCTYAGYTSQKILTTLATESTCPASDVDDNASPVSLQSSSWCILFILIHLVIVLHSSF